MSDEKFDKWQVKFFETFKLRKKKQFDWDFVLDKTHNTSNAGKTVSASVGTRCSIFPSMRSVRRFFKCTNETPSKCIIAFASSCLRYFRFFIHFFYSTFFFYCESVKCYFVCRVFCFGCAFASKCDDKFNLQDSKNAVGFDWMANEKVKLFVCSHRTR